VTSLIAQALFIYGQHRFRL